MPYFRSEFRDINCAIFYGEDKRLQQAILFILAQSAVVF